MDTGAERGTRGSPRHAGPRALVREVIMLGTMEDTPLKYYRPGFNYSEAGNGGTFAVTYNGTYGVYFDKLLAYPINLILDDVLATSFSELEEVRKMPQFPATGSCKIVNGIAVIKFSEGK